MNNLSRLGLVSVILLLLQLSSAQTVVDVGNITCGETVINTLPLATLHSWTFNMPQFVGRVTVETCPSKVDTVLSVYERITGNLTFSGDDCGGCGVKNLRERVQFYASQDVQPIGSINPQEQFQPTLSNINAGCTDLLGNGNINGTGTPVMRVNEQYDIRVELASNSGAGEYTLTAYCHTASPSRAPSLTPTNTPTSVPSSSPTFLPTDIPTNIPTLIPTLVPTVSPSAIPTTAPSSVPSTLPTNAPTTVPSYSPSQTPSYVPSIAPSTVPSDVPSTLPSDAPSSVPSHAPSSIPSDVPSGAPSFIPSDAPTSTPSFVPSAAPSMIPSHSPSFTPSFVPSDAPSSVPSQSPSFTPSSIPSLGPSSAPTDIPSDAPSTSPSDGPSSTPSDVPTSAPSAVPSFSPTTSSPTVSPTTTNPTHAPSSIPTDVPTFTPSQIPTQIPTLSPSTAPTTTPTQKPSATPSIIPTATPSMAPTSLPSDAPTAAPTSFVPCNESVTGQLGPLGDAIYSFSIPANVQSVTISTCDARFVTDFDTTFEIMDTRNAISYYFADDCGDCAQGKRGENVTFAVGRYVATQNPRGCGPQTRGFPRLNASSTYNVRIAGLRQDTCLPQSGNFHLTVLCHTIAPTLRADPLALIVGPSLVSECENVIISGSLSSGGAGRALTYTWTLSHTFPCISAANLTQPNLVIPYTCFNSTNTSFTATLTVQNYISPLTDTKSHTFERRQSNSIPRISFDASSAQTIQSDTAVSWTAFILPPIVCTGTTPVNPTATGITWYLMTDVSTLPAYVWTNLNWNASVVASNMNPAVYSNQTSAAGGRLVITTSQTSLYIAPNTLTENLYYIFECEIIGVGWTGIEYVGVFVNPAIPTSLSPVTQFVSLGLTDVIAVDLNQLFVLPSNQMFSMYSVMWGCTVSNGSACMVMPVLMSGSVSVYTISRASLMAGKTYGLTATLSGTVSNDVVLVTSDATSTDVSLSVLFGRADRMNPSERIVIAATVLPAGSYSYSWMCTSTYCPASAAMSTFGNTITIDGSIVPLAGGSSFDIRVDVMASSSSSNMTGMGSMTVTTNAAPGTGAFTLVQPCIIRGHNGSLFSGLAFLPYTIVCDNWFDLDDPLQYSFAVADSQGRELQMRYFRTTNSLTFTLGRGRYNVIARVADRFGSVSERSWPVMSYSNATDIVGMTSSFVAGSLSDIIALNDLNNLSVTVMAAVSTLNPDPALYSLFPAVETAANLATIQTVTGDCISAILSVSPAAPKNPESFSLLASVMHYAVKNPNHIPITQHEAIVIMLGTLLTDIAASVTLPLNSQIRLSTQIANDIIGAIGATMSAVSSTSSTGRRRLQLSRAKLQSISVSAQTILERSLEQSLEGKRPNEVGFRVSNAYLEAEAKVLAVSQSLIGTPLVTCGSGYVSVVDGHAFFTRELGVSLGAVNCMFSRQFVDVFNASSGVTTSGDVVSLSFSRAMGVTGRRRLQNTPIAVTNLSLCAPVLLQIPNKNGTAFHNGTGPANTTYTIPQCEVLNQTSGLWTSSSCHVVSTNDTMTQCACRDLGVTSISSQQFSPALETHDTTTGRDLNNDNVNKYPTTLIVFLLITLLGCIWMAFVPGSNDKPVLSQPRAWSIHQRTRAWYQSYDGQVTDILTSQDSYCRRICQFWWVQMRNDHVIVAFWRRVSGTNHTSTQRVLCIISALVTMAMLNATIFGYEATGAFDIAGMIFMSSFVAWFVSKTFQIIFEQHTPTVFMRENLSCYQKFMSRCDRFYAQEIFRTEGLEKLYYLMALGDIEGQQLARVTIDVGEKRHEHVKPTYSQRMLSVRDSQVRVLGHERLVVDEEPKGTVDEAQIEAQIAFEDEVRELIGGLSESELADATLFSQIEELNQDLQPTGNEILLTKEEIIKLSFIQFHMLEKKFVIPHWASVVPYICALILAVGFGVILCFYGVNFDVASRYAVSSSLMSSTQTSCNGTAFGVDIPLTTVIAYNSNAAQVGALNALNTSTRPNGWNMEDAYAFMVNTLLSWIVYLLLMGPCLTFVYAVGVYHYKVRTSQSDAMQMERSTQHMAAFGSVDFTRATSSEPQVDEGDHVGNLLGAFTEKQLILAPFTVLYHPMVMSMTVEHFQGIIRISEQDAYIFNPDEDVIQHTPHEKNGYRSGKSSRHGSPEPPVSPGGLEMVTIKEDTTPELPQHAASKSKSKTRTRTHSGSHLIAGEEPEVEVQDSTFMMAASGADEEVYLSPRGSSNKAPMFGNSKSQTQSRSRKNSARNVVPVRSSSLGEEELLGTGFIELQGGDLDYADDEDDSDLQLRPIDSAGFGRVNIEKLMEDKDKEKDRVKMIYDQFMSADWRFLDEDGSDEMTMDRFLGFFGDAMAMSNEMSADVLNEVFQDMARSRTKNVSRKDYEMWRAQLTLEHVQQMVDGVFVTTNPEMKKDREWNVSDVNTSSMIKDEATDAYEALMEFDWRQLDVDDNGTVDVEEFIVGFAGTALDQGEPHTLLRKIFGLGDVDDSGDISSREYFILRNKLSVKKMRRLLLQVAEAKKEREAAAVENEDAADAPQDQEADMLGLAGETQV